MRLTISYWIATLSLTAVVYIRTAPQLVPLESQLIATQTKISEINEDADLEHYTPQHASGCLGCDHSFYVSEATPEDTLEAERPVVRAVMFWLNGCPSCHYVLESVLPQIQDKYGGQFMIQLIELVGAEEYLTLVQLAESLGVPKEEVFVPFMILGEDVLIGSDQIETELPGLIEKYLRQGGLDWPNGLTPQVQNTATAVGDSNSTASERVVRFIIFTTLECTSCRGEVALALKPVQEKYGNQFEYQTIDIRSSDDVEYLYQVASGYGLEREQVDLPMIIIGEHVLMGDRILAQLPVMVEGYLAAGGIDYPTLPEPPKQVARTLTPEPTFSPTLAHIEATTTPVEAKHPDGFALAIVVMAVMAVGLVYVIARFILAVVNNAVPSTTPTWQVWMVPALALIGVGVAGYLAYVETQLVHAVCGPVGDCNAVQSSSYARLFSVIPIGLLGIIGYLAILAMWSYSRLFKDKFVMIALLIVFGITFFGTLFSLYLTFLEVFVIHAVCIWCLASSIIMALLLLVSLNPAMQAATSKWTSDVKKTAS